MGTSSIVAEIGGFKVDDKIFYKKSDGKEGQGFISSLTIYSKKLPNKNSFNIC